MKSRAFTRVHLLSAYWSAAVHDYEHGGLNNDFLIKTAHPLAITYNDISPLENHHLSAAIRVMFTPECAYLPVSLCCTCMLFEHHSVSLQLVRSLCINASAAKRHCIMYVSLQGINIVLCA